MSCTVARSPVFSPSSASSLAHFCKPSSLASSPEKLTLTHSPSKLRKPPSGLIRASNDTVSSGSVATSSPTFSKRKRPAKLDIPVANLSLGFDVDTPRAAEERRREAVEVEGDGYSVYCKRGRREFMEDRYSAKLNIHEDSKQV